MGSMEEAMAFWRAEWMQDVETAYQVLLDHPGVDASRTGIGGASCGVFMGLELALAHPEVKAFVSMGGTNR